MENRADIGGDLIIFNFRLYGQVLWTINYGEDLRSGLLMREGCDIRYT